MNIERLGAVRTKRFYHRRADRDIGDEMAIHDIDMDPVAASEVDSLHLFAQPRKIGGENGRGDTNIVGHGASLN